ncbi:hypothetical protein Sjap_015036 [Stephania japonica]|uniref:BAH domain-containing protein n=1 Tax=Stephania japonica TaxID=461633 RepID=A0AAP0IID7_9MAGN
MEMASQQYVEWQELMVSKEKGRREVQYLLKRRDSDSWDLGVVGKERTQRHMSYRYAIPDRNPSWPKLKSRRDVLDWISSIVSDLPSHSSLPSLDSNSLDADGSLGKEIAASKLHDFVYILSEDNKRLVAHLEDLYEDSRGNKMVVVRWFHKIDEVGLVLPPNFNVREIFFSLCLQDISVECIDGVAAILNPQHYKKYVSDARHSSWDPFLCHRLFHEDNLSAFDITHVQGYWKQEILRWMFTDPPDNQLIPNITGNSCADGDDDEAINNRALKRLRKAKARDPVQLMNEKKDATEAGHEEKKLFCNGVGNCEAELSGLKNVKFCIGLSEKKKIKKMTNEKLAINCHVEVLSQDSGIRGCWFRALVLKRHKDKVKVRYQDIKDAEDEANCLEEWILSSKIAVPNELGIWNHRRATVRPEPSCRKGSVSLDLVDSGSIVDAWWNDGWWEGIVVRKESKDKIHVKKSSPYLAVES